MPARKILHWLYHLCAFVGVVYFFVLVVPVVRWGGQILGGTLHDPTGDTLIILGGSLLDRDLIGTNSYWRAIYGTLAWHEGGFRRIIVTGGGTDEGTIAEPMKRFLTCYGVPPEVIELELKSNDTWENALLTKQLTDRLPPPPPGARTKYVLMTSDYHMFRALRCFRKAGFQIEPRPFPDLVKRSNCYHCRWGAFQDLVQEVAKIGYYAARGRL